MSLISFLISAREVYIKFLHYGKIYQPESMNSQDKTLILWRPPFIASKKESSNLYNQHSKNAQHRAIPTKYRLFDNSFMQLSQSSSNSSTNGGSRRRWPKFWKKVNGLLTFSLI